MKQKSIFTITLWWLLLLAVTGALIICFAPRTSRVSNTENRMLQGMPELSAESILNGTFSSEFESFMSDGFFERSSIINFSNQLLGLLSATTPEDDYILDRTEDAVADFGNTVNDEITDTGSPAASDDNSDTAAESVSGDNKSDCEASLWLDKHDGGITSIYTYPQENISTVAETINIYRDLLPDSGSVYYAQVPFPKLALRWSDNRSVYSGWSSSLEAELDKRTDDDVHVFSVVDILEPHIIDNEYIYYTTDHHWTALGAYYVFAEMIASQGLPVIPYDEYEYKINENSPDINGNTDEFHLLYSLQPTHSLVVSNITEETEVPLMYYDTDMYHAYLASTQTPWRRIITGFNTGRKALVIGDSFVNSFTPYLLPYYDEVHLTDIRPTYFDRNELGTSVEDMIKRNEIDDIYFIFSEANSVNSNTQLECLLENLY